jgi:hypothetical protein
MEGGISANFGSEHYRKQAHEPLNMKEIIKKDAG